MDLLANTRADVQEGIGQAPESLMNRDRVLQMDALIKTGVFSVYL
jgi:hypothetical protein